MHKLVKVTKNPITWIIFAGACIIGAIIWAFRPEKED